MLSKLCNYFGWLIFHLHLSTCSALTEERVWIQPSIHVFLRSTFIYEILYYHVVLHLICFLILKNSSIISPIHLSKTWFFLWLAWLLIIAYLTDMRKGCNDAMLWREWDQLGDWIRVSFSSTPLLWELRWWCTQRPAAWAACLPESSVPQTIFISFGGEVAKFYEDVKWLINCRVCVTCFI